MKRVLIFFSLIALLVGVIFFFTLDFREQEEVGIGSTESDTLEDPLGNINKEGLNSSQNKTTLKEGKDQPPVKVHKVENSKGTEIKEEEVSNGTVSEFELDPQYYPSLGGYLKVDGKDIQALEIFFRKTESFIISLSFTKVTNSIFQVENSFWNLHQNSDGKSYNLRIGSGPLSGNIVTFTPKREEGGTDNTIIEQEEDSGDTADSEEQSPYEDESLNNEQEGSFINEEESTSSNESYND